MAKDIAHGSFVWDGEKEAKNRRAHGVDFAEASQAFFDPHRVIAVDEAHSKAEPRYFCIGRVGERVATVRFTYRRGRIRIIGAGYWRKGRRLYEAQNKKGK